MESWSVPPRPSLPGVGTVPELHDTATGHRQISATGPDAGIYVCGITPYDAAHIGHAATYVTFDLLVRAWADAGLRTTYVQNVTDVDDPLLERAADTGQDWTSLATRETAVFRDDMAAIAVTPPDHFVGVVEAMPLVAEAVGELRRAGALYPVEADWYYPVETAPDFGAVSHLSAGEMVALCRERGGDPDRPGKRNPLDCLVWRAERDGEPAWDSPVGRGRPGWHVECVAIALHHLGAGFAVQGGGTDLIFPHHEMCAAQGRSVTGAAVFAHTYAHQAMVSLDGEKMSKSLGNLVFVSKLRAGGVPPAAIRLALLDHHYRTEWEWRDDVDITRATDRLARWRAATRLPAGPPAGPLLADVRAALAADLDAPRAVRAVDAWATAALADAGAATDPTAPGLARDTCAALLGVVVTDEPDQPGER